MRVCYFGTYRANYSRNRIMIEGLRQNGVEVILCQEPLWHGVEDRVNVVRGGWLSPGFWWRIIRTYYTLLKRYLRIGGDYDVLVVGYAGQLDVFLARLLSCLHGKPLVWDVFMSVYLIALERGLGERNKLAVGLIRSVEKIACRIPDLLILDTAEYVAWFSRIHGVAESRFRLVPTGADNRIFKQGTFAPRAKDDKFEILYYGTFIPNHGTPYIIEAANILKDQRDIHFTLVGEGPDQPVALMLSQRYALQNVTFVNWMDKGALVERIAAADVCLGVFGVTPQSMMTIQNKIYEAMAMARPIITGESPTVCSTFVHGENIYLCQRAAPASLAEAICALQSNPILCRKLASNGFDYYSTHFTVQHIGQQFRHHLMEAFLGKQT